MDLVTTTYLEMRSPDQLNLSTKANGLVVVEAEIKQFQLNRFLYQLSNGNGRSVCVTGSVFQTGPQPLH